MWLTDFFFSAGLKTQFRTLCGMQSKNPERSLVLQGKPKKEFVTQALTSISLAHFCLESCWCGKESVWRGSFPLVGVVLRIIANSHRILFDKICHTFKGYYFCFHHSLNDSVKWGSVWKALPVHRFELLGRQRRWSTNGKNIVDK